MTDSRPDVLVVGDVMADVTVAAGTLAPGGDVHGEVQIRPGGAGANAAVWASSRGAAVRLYGRTGDDLMGKLLTLALRERGVEAALSVDYVARTGAMLVVREEGERSMVADRGANAHLAAADLPSSLEAGAVLVSGYLLFDPGSEEAAVAALERAGAPLIAVEGASWPLLARYGRARFFDSTACANLLLVNEREAMALAELPDNLLEHYAHVCVKLGRRGALYLSADRPPLRVPTSPVPDVDPTGAGDAFDGALLASLVRGLAVQDALRDACLAGAQAASSPNPWPELP